MTNTTEQYQDNKIAIYRQLGLASIRMETAQQQLASAKAEYERYSSYENLMYIRVQKDVLKVTESNVRCIKRSIEDFY